MGYGGANFHGMGAMGYGGANFHSMGGTGYGANQLHGMGMMSMYPYPSFFPGGMPFGGLYPMASGPPLMTPERHFHIHQKPIQKNTQFIKSYTPEYKEEESGFYPPGFERIDYVLPSQSYHDANTPVYHPNMRGSYSELDSMYAASHDTPKEVEISSYSFYTVDDVERDGGRVDEGVDGGGG